MYEFVRDYAKQRIGGGKPIIEHGNVGPQITEMAVTIEAARLLCYRGCCQLDDLYKTEDKKGISGIPFVVDTTRFYVLHAMVKVCQLAAEVLSAAGSTSEAPLEAFILRTYGMYHGEGTPIFRLHKAARTIDDFVPTGY